MPINSMRKFNLKKRIVNNPRGFVLPFTLLISAVILSVATAISVILVKELYFSKLSRESQTAYYAADNGLMCAIAIDDNFIDPATGLGIFEYDNITTSSAVLTKINNERISRGLLPFDLYGGINPIKCATSEIFNPDINSITFTVGNYSHINSSGGTDLGRTSKFVLHMALGDGSGTSRCAKVTVNKTSNYRQIISQGYTDCPGTKHSSPIERAVVNETEIK